MKSYQRLFSRLLTLSPVGIKAKDTDERHRVPLDRELIRTLAGCGMYRKLLNYVVTTIQYNRRSTFLFGYPYHVYIDPSSRCTLQCPFCAVGSRNYPKPMKDMPLDSFKRILDELGPYLLAVELFVRGEPFLNRDIYDMIALCKKYRIFTRVSSNMQSLNEGDAEKMVESGLDHLLASIDGVSQESYQEYRRRGKVDVAFMNVRRVVEAKKRLGKENPFVEWKYIVFRHNEGEMEEARTMAIDLGVDLLNFVGAVVGEAPLRPDQEKWLPLNSQYRIYDTAGSDVQKDTACRDLLQACNLPWMSMTFDPHLNVQTCCRPLHHENDHGKLQRNFFWSVWNGRRYIQSRRYIKGTVKNEPDKTNLCVNCPSRSSLSTVLPRLHESL